MWINIALFKTSGDILSKFWYIDQNFGKIMT